MTDEKKLGATTVRIEARDITDFEVDDLPCQIACQIPRGDGTEGTFDPNSTMAPKEQRKVDDFIVYAMAAADEALSDADWKPEAHEDQIRTGVLIGSGIGGISGIVDAGYDLRDRGPRRISPFFIPGRLINLAGGYVSIKKVSFFLNLIEFFMIFFPGVRWLIKISFPCWPAVP